MAALAEARMEVMIGMRERTEEGIMVKMLEVVASV